MATRGKEIAEGKTKKLFENADHLGEVIMFSKDDITGGDGKRHDIIPGKGAISNKISCNVFAHLARLGIPVAYLSQLSENEMMVLGCDMIPLEVVVRRSAQGSILERQPEIQKFQRFDELIYEIFLKTSGKQWRGFTLTCDDPYIKLEGRVARIYDAHSPLAGQQPCLSLHIEDILPGAMQEFILNTIRVHATKTFLALEQAYLACGNFELVDFKIEFGLTSAGRLVIADVIDAESVRLRRGGKNFDKQPYREEGLNPELIPRWLEVLKATEGFASLGET